jgi:glycosyltransferase involved in cell wall biosynthesis
MAQELVQRKHSVTILISPYDNLQDSGKEYEVDGVRIINLAIESNRLHDLLPVPLQFLSTVKELKPDVVHVFKPKGLSGVAAWLFELLRRWPVVIDCDDWEGTGGWNDVSHYGFLTRAFIDVQEEWIPPFAGAVTSASRLLMQRYKKTVPAERLFYIPNGPKLSLKSEMRRSTAERECIREKLGLRGKSVVVYAGHLNPADEPEFVLRTFSKVIESRPSAHLLVVGDGPSAKALRNMSTELKLCQVEFTGWVDYAHYLDLLYAADIAFYPYPDSLVYASKCSGKIIEFMCVGKPVVSTAVGQNLDYIENGKSGILVPPANVTAAAEALINLIDDSQLAANLGRAANHRIYDEFSWVKLGNSLEKSYLTAKDS